MTDADRLGTCDADLVPDAEAVPENDSVPEAEDVDERLRDGVPVLEAVPVALRVAAPLCVVVGVPEALELVLRDAVTELEGDGQHESFRPWIHMPAKAASSAQPTPLSMDATGATGTAKPRRGTPPLWSTVPNHSTATSQRHASRKKREVRVLSAREPAGNAMLV